MTVGTENDYISTYTGVNFSSLILLSSNRQVTIFARCNDGGFAFDIARPAPPPCYTKGRVTRVLMAIPRLKDHLLVTGIVRWLNTNLVSRTDYWAFG